MNSKDWPLALGRTRKQVFCFVVAMAILPVWLLLGCQSQVDAGRMDGETITVAAAADLQFAFGEIGAAFKRDSGRDVVFVFGSTGTLARQIENGAPLDVFAAADVQALEGLAARSLLIADSQQLYAVGRIVLVSSKRAGVGVRSLADLARPDVRKVAIANPEHAPYGAAARQALAAAGLWEQVQPKLVYGENVRQALQFVETGNAEAGIAALSLAGGPEIDYVLIDQDLHQPLRQALAVVARTKHEQTARAFVAFVNGPQGRSIMKKYGFLLPGES